MIEEAHKNGARYFKACEVAEISLRSLQRWKRDGMRDQRKGSHKRVVRKLSPEDRKAIVTLCNSFEYRDLTPHQIVPLLLNEGCYLASPSTFYRVLKERNMVHHRGNTRVKRKMSKPPERQASKPNQVCAKGISSRVLGYHLVATIGSGPLFLRLCYHRYL